MNKNIFTSESVTKGHPDKICDQISDAILDEYLKKDPDSKVGCECVISTNFLCILGEITSRAKNVDVTKIAKNVIRDIGYDNPELGFSLDKCEIINKIHQQSRDIARGIDKEDSIGAGDQGMVFGYAINGTSDYMPYPISIAHSLTRRLTKVREDKILDYLRPDGKAQVSVEFDDANKIKRVDTIVLSAQHNPDVSIEQIEDDIKKHVINEVEYSRYIDSNTKIYINPTGRFVLGGPACDTGLTGRKIIVDTYGGWGRHGGGAFSGKDPTKIDRSASYMARYAAKNIVASGLANECEIQLSYAIGKSEPVSVRVNVDSLGDGLVVDNKLSEAAKKVFDFSLQGIIHTLNLKRPIYLQTAMSGHFGMKDVEFPWERLDKIDELKSAIL